MNGIGLMSGMMLAIAIYLVSLGYANGGLSSTAMQVGIAFIAIGSVGLLSDFASRRNSAKKRLCA